MKQFVRLSKLIAVVALVTAVVIGCEESASALRFAQGVVMAMSGIALWLAIRLAERLHNGEKFTE